MSGRLPAHAHARVRVWLSCQAGRRVRACLQGHVDAARLLLNNGAEVDRRRRRAQRHWPSRRKGALVIVALLV